MNNLSKIRLFAMSFATLFLGLTSCNDDDVVTPVVTLPPTPVDNTIAGKAIATPDLSILVAALSKTDLVGTLQGTGPFTVFAPTNAAFGLLNISVASINASTPAQVAALKEILLNHVVAGSNTATQLTDNSYLRTLSTGLASPTNKLSMFVKKTITASSIVVKLNNNATVVTPNIAASNGIIHIVDKVITAPTIVDLVIANTDFSSLVTSLTTANLVTTLQGNGPFTVFAPNNTAFTNLVTEIPAAATLSATSLGNVLKYHVVAGNFLASNLPAVVAAGATTTLNPQTFTIGVTPVPQITGTYAPARSASKIIATDIQGNNGVVHVLDKVLLPATF